MFAMNHSKQRLIRANSGVYLLLLFTFFTPFVASGQPPNDLCKNAHDIAITDGGFGLGLFVGAEVSVDSATREIGEQCSEDIYKLGNCGKTVWYSFYIPTTRDVEILLTQTDSAIPQIFAGFTVYEAPDCDYNKNDLSTQLTPLAKFGASGNACLRAGHYLIQVAVKSRTRGKLWIQIQIEKSISPTYNDHTTPHDFGLIHNRAKNLYVETSCLDIEKIEKSAINNPDYSRSFWFSFKLGFNSILDYVECASYYPIGYRFFSEAPNSDSLKSTKPFIFTADDYYKILINEACKSPTMDTTYYVQLLVSSRENSVQINLKSYSEVEDDWNTPATSFVIETKHGYNRTIEKYFDCSGLLSDHSCKNVIPEFFTIKSRLTSGEVDTLRYASYTIIDSKDIGEFHIQAVDARNYGYSLMYVLYEGDIRNGCGLKEVERTGVTSRTNFCLEKKVYTLLMVKYDHFASTNYIQLRISQRKWPTSIKHYHHDEADFMGNVKPSENIFITSKSVNIHHRDTSVNIDTFSWKGRFIFFEFYLEETSVLNIHSTDSRFRKFVFSGRNADANLTSLKGYNYVSNRSNLCRVYDKGYYTVVLLYDTTIHGYSMCNLAETEIRLAPIGACKIAVNNTNPEDAIKINGNTDLNGNFQRRIGIRFEYNLTTCWDCNTVTNKKPVIPCNRKIPKYWNLDSIYFFYTFRLDLNAEIELPNNSVLYKGDVTTDSDVCQDSNNVIDPCGGYSIYCNLKGGQTYTIVIYNNRSYEVGNEKYKVIGTPHIKTPNDYAVKAYDFKELKNGVSVTSLSHPMTCHTSTSKSDPCKGNENGYNLCYYNYLYSVPFVDTLNKSRPKDNSNIWYTFTVTDASRIDVTLTTPEHCTNTFTVYRYTGSYYENFSDLLSNGFDSTDRSFKLVARNGQNSAQCYENYLRFNNNGCSKNRYFVIVNSAQAPNQEYSITLKKTFIPNIKEDGDNCSNAISDKFLGYGTKLLRATNNCHSYGASPFEDETDRTLISTWFEINVSGLDKFDMSIKYMGTTHIDKYIVYAGSCGGLTKVMELKDKYAFFTLSCMGEGTYYVQAITSSYYVGKLTFEFNIAKPKNEKCAPYDFEIPLAQFETLGGCTQDTILFNNISTAGNSINYVWYVNGVRSGSDFDLEILKTNSNLKYNNKIKLVVFNISTDKSDSITENYRNDTTNYTFKMKHISDFICSDTIDLSVETNYPYKLNYEWSPVQRFANQYASSQQVQGISKAEITVKAVSDNCEFYDTSLLVSAPSSGFFKDGYFCDSIYKLKYDIREYLYFRVNNDLYVGDTFVISDTGTYNLLFYYKKCYFYDTIHITYGEYSVQTDFDTVTMCNKAPLNLSYQSPLQSYTWNTGSTDSFITVSNVGEYQLKGKILACLDLEYNVTVLNESVPTSFLKDTTVCRYDKIPFTNPLPEYTVFSKQPNTDSIQGLENRLIYMSLVRNNCVVKDSAQITVLKSQNAEVDSFACFTDIMESIWLDAGNALQYDWLAQNNTEQLLEVGDYNKYTVVKLNQRLCSDSTTFNVITNCPRKVFIPNSFSPNYDLINPTFKPVVIGAYEYYKMTVFNRWGEKIFESANNQAWNGHYQNSQVPSGVYLVLIEIKYANGTQFHDQLVHVIY